MCAPQQQTQLQNVGGIRNTVVRTKFYCGENVCTVFAITKSDNRRAQRDLFDLIDNSEALAVLRIFLTEIDKYHVGPVQDLLHLR